MPSNSRPGMATTNQAPASRRSPDPAQPRPVPMLLRYISCGLLSLAGGAAWRFTVSPNAVGIVTGFAGIFFLLLGFLVGGVYWYAHDLRVRKRTPELMPDERLVFSFVVFVIMPFAVLALIGVIWLLALLIGVH
ncbi:MAG: hypothetical protein WAL84_08575 [Candidatus Dormiibacterota bacterium]